MAGFSVEVAELAAAAGACSRAAVELTNQGGTVDDALAVAPKLELPEAVEVALAVAEGVDLAYAETAQVLAALSRGLHVAADRYDTVDKRVAGVEVPSAGPVYV